MSNSSPPPDTTTTAADETVPFSLLGYPDGSSGGWANVSDLFRDFGRKQSENPDEKLSPPDDLAEWFQITSLTGLLGFFGAGMSGLRDAAQKYKDENFNTKFHGQFHAQRELNYASFMGFARQGARVGGKLTLFTGIFLGAALLMDRYRGRKYDMLDSTVSGAATGALLSLTGSVPLVRAVTLGSTLGTVMGVSRSTGYYLWQDLELANRPTARQLEDATRLQQLQKENRLKVISHLISDLEAQIRPRESPGSAPKQ